MKNLVLHTKNDVYTFNNVFNVYYDFTCNTIKFQYYHGLKIIYGIVSDIVSFKVY